MDDLISRSAVLEVLKKYSWCDLTDYLERGKVESALYKLPVVDAVPVVRCRECAHYDHGFCWRFDTEDNYPNDYCSYGVSKDTKGEQACMSKF